MNTYEVIQECWIEGSRYLPSQLIKLTEIQAKEWLDRACIKEIKSTKQVSKITS